MKGMLVSIVSVFAVLVGLVSLATGKPQYIKAAKDAGLPAQNCQYCHTAALPKKETFKTDDLNERGKWLAAEAKKKNAPAADPAWLKEYPGPKEQAK